MRAPFTRRYGRAFFEFHRHLCPLARFKSKVRGADDEEGRGGNFRAKLGRGGHITGVGRRKVGPADLAVDDAVRNIGDLVLGDRVFRRHDLPQRRNDDFRGRRPDLGKEGEKAQKPADLRHGAPFNCGPRISQDC